VRARAHLELLREDAVMLFIAGPVASGGICGLARMLACGVALEAPLLVKIGSGAAVTAVTTSVWKVFQRRSSLSLEAIARTIWLLFS
jgi:hypothetical protein